MVSCFAAVHLRSRGSTVSLLSLQTATGILRSQTTGTGESSTIPLTYSISFPKHKSLHITSETSADIHLLSLSLLERSVLCGRGNGQLDNCLSSCTGSSFYKLIKLSFIDINSHKSSLITFSFTLCTSLCSHIQMNGRVTKLMYVGKTQICPVRFKCICLMLEH